MRRIKSMIIIQLCIVLIYLIITIFSITIQPINLILGIFCTLVVPGYNLLKIIKPQFTILQKIGYFTILSLAIINIFMFFSYIFLYDLTVLTGDFGFYFDPIILITSIQILNLTLIFINELISSKKHKKKNSVNRHAHKGQISFPNININGIVNKTNLKSLISFILFFFSLIFLCVSTMYSEVPNNHFMVNYLNYRSNFTFFLRVPLIFYFFLIISILSLTYIIFSVKNNYIILTSISIFLYCLWILPYLQIKNFFSTDPKLLFDLYQSYLNFGIKPIKNNYGLTQNLNNLMIPHRYSTSIFTTILLVNATQTDVMFVLWFIYPLNYVLIPFLFYSIFQKYSNKELNNSKNPKIFILTILAILTPQFIKFAHSATTGVLGTYIFIILTMELYSFTKERKFNKTIFFLILILFFFLSITHTEESIYFLIFIFIYCIFHLITNYDHINKNVLSEHKKLRRFLLIWAILLLFLLLIFYFTQEFFGWIPSYINMIFPRGSNINDFIIKIYSNSKFTFIINLQNSFTFSYIAILLIILGVLLFYFVLYLLLFKSNKLITRINKFGRRIGKIIHRIIIKIISKKNSLFLLPIIIYGSLFIIDWIFFPFLKEEGILILFELILSLVLYVINIFLFIIGIKYYSLKDIKQNYFLIAIFSCSLIFSIFIIIGNLHLAIYVLVFRLFSLFVFFNLMIIEGTYFNVLMKKNKIFNIILVVLLLFIGVFYSLRTLSFG